MILVLDTELFNWMILHQPRKKAYVSYACSARTIVPFKDGSMD